MRDYISNILDKFNLDSEAAQYRPYGHGHINSTYLVSCTSGTRYILQKINTLAFKDPDALMENISAVTEFLRARCSEPGRTVQIIKSRDGRDYIRCADGSCWRVLAYIEDALCLDAPECPEDFYQSAIAFGSFQQQLKDFPAESLHESIPNFHNTPDRYRIFKESLKKDCCGRAKNIKNEISFVLEREEEASVLQDMLKRGELPLRVTHNDTKLNNVMLDKKTRKALCVIDLDTVMPGLSLYDYGDAIRFGASTAAEDEENPELVEIDLKLFESFTRGYLKACPDLCANERKMLPMGAKLMTLECGLRFLTDYLDGDIYFATEKPEHNLIRARNQFKLVQDMELKWHEMQEIVKSIK